MVLCFEVVSSPRQLPPSSNLYDLGSAAAGRRRKLVLTRQLVDYFLEDTNTVFSVFSDSR